MLASSLGLFTLENFLVCAESAYYVTTTYLIPDYVVASFCCWWHCRVDEQILLWSNYRQILWGKSKSKHIYYALSFWNLRFTKSLVASFQYLLSSCVKNVVIGNGRKWFLYSKWRLLTQHIREYLPVWPGPFSQFWAGPGEEAKNMYRLPF